VASSENGNRVLSGGRDNTAKLWDADTGRLIRTFEGHSATVFRDITSVAFSPDGAYVLAGGQDKKLKLWEANTGRLIHTFEGHADWVTSVAFSPDGARVFSGSKDRTVKLWDAGTGRLIHTSERHSDEFMGTTSIAISPAGAQVVSGDDPIVKLWDISLDGTRVLSGGGDNMAKLWDVGTGRLIHSFRGHANWVSSVAFSRDGTLVLSGSGDETVKLWNAGTGRLIHTFKGHAGTVNSVAFSPDGARVLSGSNDETVKLWEAGTGRLIRTFKGHTASVHSVAYSRNGTRVLSGSADTTIRIWDATTGQELVRMIASPHGDWLAMTPEGFFASSPKANDLLSIVRDPKVTSIEQIHQSLYDPDLVREKLAGDPDKDFAKAVKVMNLAKVLDSGQVPTIEIIAPKSDFEAKADLIEAEATITDTGGGIGRIEWRVNGITSGVETPPRGSAKTITVKRQLALDPGENIIEVVAYNGRNLLASLPQRTTIKWQGAADAGKGRLFVLAIGIDAYSDSKFGRLKLAVKDAKDFSAAIEAAGMGEYASVHVVTAPDRDATPENLDKLVNDIASKITPRDTFILFAAAHGTSKDGRFYLIPYGYDSNAPGTLAEKAIGQDRLQDWVANRIKARKALILLDTCESGALVGGHTRSRVDVPASEAAVGRLHEATGRPVLTAAASGKAALEGYKKENGLFTWAVLDALRNGDTGGNGIIELSELAAHVQSLVPKLTDEMRRHGTSDVGKRAAFTVPVPEAAAPYSTFRQSARFGSRGENFSVVRRLQ
jgi:WD40 repeat protein